MKNTLVKVWGIVLTVAILAGLLITAVPVSASTTQFSVVNAPTAFTTAGTVDFLVAAKDGTTMFAYDNVNKKFYKSANAGVSFAPTSATGSVPPSNKLDGATMKAMSLSPDFANDNTIIVAVVDPVLGELVMLSTNGGATFRKAPQFTLGFGESINCVAIATGAGGQVYAYGTNVTLHTYDSDNGWVDQSTVTGYPGGNVVGVAYSPNYATDLMIFAVTDTGAAAKVSNRILNPAYNWNAPYGAVAFTVISGGVPVAFGGITNTYFGFGTDYATYASGFVVGINGSANDDAYLINPFGPPSSALTRLNITTVGGVVSATHVTSVSVNGALANGVYVGQDTGKVSKGTGVGGASVAWVNPAAAQLGANAKVVALSGGIYAGCGGGAFISAVYVSKDDTASFKPISLISVASQTALTVKSMVAVDTKTIFLMLTEVGGDIMFKTTDGGASWTEIYVNTNNKALGVYVSPAYATDNTVYVPEATAPAYVKKSSNGGASFIPQVMPGGTPTSFVAVDGTTFYVGNLEKVYKSNRFTPYADISLPTTNNMAGATFTSLAMAGTVVYAGLSNGAVLSSSDDALTFSQVGGPGTTVPGASNVTVVVDPVYAANKTIYATCGTAIYGFTIGVSVNWGTGVGGAAKTINSIALDPTGNLYAGTDNVGTIVRILNPSAPPSSKAEDAIVNSLEVATLAIPATADFSQVNALTDGSNVTILSAVNGMTAPGPVPYDFRIVSFTDNVINAPTGIKISPVSAKGETDIAWDAYPAVWPGNDVLYDVQVCKDNSFADQFNPTKYNAVLGSFKNINPSAFTPGGTYYVRVRVTAAKPLVSNWSTGIQFSVPLTEPGSSLTDVGNLSPAAGALINYTNTPTFTWAQVLGAISYNVQIFNTPEFSGTPVVDASGLTNTVYTSTKALDPGTYYWQVRAVAGDVKGNWIQSSFTIAKATATATGTGTQTITIPPITIPTITVPPVTVPPATVTVSVPTPTVTVVPQEAATPAWTWVLIVIGAVLVIAVIVLIVRTRRV